MTIDRLTGGPGQCIQISEPKPYAFTRAELVTALTRIKVRPVAQKVPAEWMADAILETLDDLADEREG
jgi:hypothetical protein